MTRINYRNGLQTRRALRLAYRIEFRFPGRRPCDSVQRPPDYGPRQVIAPPSEAQRLAASLAIAADVADVQSRRSVSGWW